MKGEPAPYEPAPTLPASRAFVVHFSTGGRGRSRFVGRVEHLATGRATNFASLRELLAFVSRLLDAPREPS